MNQGPPGRITEWKAKNKHWCASKTNQKKKKKNEILIYWGTFVLTTQPENIITKASAMTLIAITPNPSTTTYAPAASPVAQKSGVDLDSLE